MPDKVKFSRYFPAYPELFCQRGRLAAKTSMPAISKFSKFVSIYTEGLRLHEQKYRVPVGSGPDGLPSLVSYLGQSKSRILGVAVIGDKDVGGLDVTMNDVLRVGGVEGIGEKSQSQWP